MTKSLAGAAARVDRLWRRLERAESDVEALASTWTDGELERQLVALMEDLTGPAFTYDSGEEFVEAVLRLNPSSTRHHALARAHGYAHWGRERWLRDHRRHGDLVIERPTNCVHPPFGHWGPGIVAVCGCGARLAILHELWSGDTPVVS